MFFRQIVTIFVLETSYFVFCSFQLLANDCLDLYESLSSDLAYNSNFGIYIMLHFVLRFAHFCVFSLLVSFPDDTSRFYIQTPTDYNFEGYCPCVAELLSVYF